MLIFKYHKAVDRRCWRRLILARQMFGRTFPDKIPSLNKASLAARSKIDFFRESWTKFEPIFNERIGQIYRKSKLPQALVCYINTSPYSMDDFSRGYISVTARLKTPTKIREIVAHEYGHFLFREHYANYAAELGFAKPEIEDLKEIITMLHKPVLGLLDTGYQIHTTRRTLALRLWHKYHDLEKVITGLKGQI